MRDYWLTQYVLATIGWSYALVCVIATALALWLPKSKKNKLFAVVVIIGLASILPFRGYEQYRKSQLEAQIFKERYAKAQALFDERCKTAGEQIYRTVEGVEGLLLEPLRPTKISDASQFDADDQYGYNVGGEEYVRYYLIGSNDLVSQYRFVEAPTAKGKYRYTTPLNAAISHDYWTRGGGKVPINEEEVAAFSARYAIEWKDISVKEDRDNWIAGGILRITDRSTGELLGERTGYLFEAGMGSTTGQRSPWPWARYYGKSCPKISEHNRVFVEKILKPTQEKKK